MNWRLAAGRLWQGVREYPRVRRRLAAVPFGPPLFLTGTHRSGTTWLARMLAASGIWYSHEPFNPNKGRWPEAFTYRRPGTRDAAVDALMGEVLAGGFRASLNLPNADLPWLPLRLLPAPASRRLVKDPLACLLAPYLTTRFDLQTLVLFRHPGGFCASVAKLGWPRAEFLRRFLADEALLSDHLQTQRALIARHADEDSLASAAVLHGALNKVLWNGVQAGMGRALHFEAMCIDPIASCRRLFEDLGLPYDEQVRTEHEALCLGREPATGQYRAHAVARNSHAMANSWRRDLGASDLREVRAIWQEFEIPLYQDDLDWQEQGIADPDELDG